MLQDHEHKAKYACSSTGWRFHGSLVEGKTKPCGEWDTGEMWECPFFVELPGTGGTVGFHQLY